MLKSTWPALGLIYCCGLATNLAADDAARIKITHSQKPSGVQASLRGLCVVDSNTVWASGSDGVVLRTTDGGENWEEVSVANAREFDFRDVQAFDANTAVALSAGSPAVIYRTENGGRSWKMVFRDDRPGVFFDAMAFWDHGKGIAFSDPIGTDKNSKPPNEHRIPILRTHDFGQTWTASRPAQQPLAMAGEAGFAASGTCLAVAAEKHAWIGLGGKTDSKQSRVLRSIDGGVTWTGALAPLPASESAGVFSLAFLSETAGVAVGGDYKDPEADNGCVAVTTDGGTTWRVPSGSQVTGFRACVAAGRYGSGVLLIAVGRNGSDYSLDRGETWTRLDTPRYNSIAFAPATATAWSVGPDGTIARWSIE